jgi:hypothetical protein
VLIIGWKAREAHFLGFLRKALNGRKIQAQAVAGGEKFAIEAIENLVGAGISVDPLIFSAGFSEYIEQRGAEGFFDIDGPS